jgi:cysteine-rich repeat protein
MTRSRRLLLLLVLLLAAACGGGGDAQNFATCGNNRLDAGERCDDGNLSDHDACTTACQPARCGDGAVLRGSEECDVPDFNGSSCADIGRSGQLGCDASCRYDFSPCTTDFTPTPTAAPPTVTPTPTATPRTAACGDGLLNPDETCDSCAADCQPQACAAGGAAVPVTVSLALPSQATRVELSLAYRTDTVILPPPLASRVRSLTTPAIPLRSTDAGGYRLTVVAQSSAIQSGAFVGVQFDACGGAPAPAADDFACVVTTCRSGTTDIADCTCSAAP